MSAESENRVDEPGATRIGRRRFVEGVSATMGSMVAGAYIKPEMRSLGAPNTLAVISGRVDTKLHVKPKKKDNDKPKKDD